MKNLHRLAFVAIALFAPSMVVAQPAINVGDFEFQENMAGQEVPIFVTGGDPVAALNFVAQIGQTDPGTGQPEAGPAIEGVELLTGTIFEGNNLGQDDTPDSSPQVIVASVITEGPPDEADTVPADGLLATLTIDTTGFFAGSGAFPLLLSGTIEGDTTFADAMGEDVIPTITNGSITLVPEPTALASLIACLPLLLSRPRRRGRGCER